MTLTKKIIMKKNKKSFKAEEEYFSISEELDCLQGKTDKYLNFCHQFLTLSARLKLQKYEETLRDTFLKEGKRSLQLYQEMVSVDTYPHFENSYQEKEKIINPFNLTEEACRETYHSQQSRQNRENEDECTEGSEDEDFTESVMNASILNSNLRSRELEIDSHFNADLCDIDLNDSIYDILNEHNEDIDLKDLKTSKITTPPKGKAKQHDSNFSGFSPLSFSYPK